MIHDTRLGAVFRFHSMHAGVLYQHARCGPAVSPFAAAFLFIARFARLHSWLGKQATSKVHHPRIPRKSQFTLLTPDILPDLRPPHPGHLVRSNLVSANASTPSMARRM